MKRHKHADMIHAWAEGAEIEWRCNNKWLPNANLNWREDREYRIKPKQQEWYEDIPEHGVLCWVSDHVQSPSRENQLRKIYAYDKHTLYIGEGGSDWNYATPLTNDEIKKFLRGE